MRSKTATKSILRQHEQRRSIAPYDCAELYSRMKNICIGRRLQFSFCGTRIQRFGGHAGHIQFIPQYRMAVGGGLNSDIHISNILIFFLQQVGWSHLEAQKPKTRWKVSGMIRFSMRKKGNGGYVKAKEGL